MNTRRMVVWSLLGQLAVTAAFGQFTPRKDYVWARDVLGASMTVDGILNEPEWAKAESIAIQYGVYDGNPGSGWKVMKVGPWKWQSASTASAMMRTRQLLMQFRCPSASGMPTG